MSVEAMTVVAGSAQRVAVRQSVRSLVETLRGSSEFQALQEAVRAVNDDDVAQGLLRQIHTHRSAFQLGQGNQVDHVTALRKLQAELDERASVQAYQQAEQAVQTLFRAVDTVISGAAGVGFAANAKRSCCG